MSEAVQEDVLDGLFGVEAPFAVRRGFQPYAVEVSIECRVTHTEAKQCHIQCPGLGPRPWLRRGVAAQAAQVGAADGVDGALGLQPASSGADHSAVEDFRDSYIRDRWVGQG